MDDFISKEPDAAQYFRPWYGAEEFINRKPRYCLYVAGVGPGELRRMPLVMQRIDRVREYRLQSKSAGTRDIAKVPTKFHVTNIPKSHYLVIPETSSENREYIPIGFMSPAALCSNAVRLMPDAALFHFGVLTSSAHMAWVRTVAGSLEMRYRYSKDVVYNNFPWPQPTPAQKAKIEQTAQAILDARELYPEASLADLYDELTMPSELRKAHTTNDKAVWEAYGKAWQFDDESACVTHLMILYLQI